MTTAFHFLLWRSRSALWLGTAGLLLAFSAWGRNDTLQFSRGSLIIPEQASFQTPCGAVSAYGLVWRLLQSNQAGHYNANHPVTVYIAINGGKASHNRCVTSNKTPAPTPNRPGPSGASNHWDDTKWNDGCDAAIINPGQQPVVPVPYGSAFPAGGVYPNAALPTVDTSSAGYTYSSWYISTTAVARPGMGQPFALDNSGVGGSRFTTIQYMGGPFIIDAPDAQNVINFLQTGDAYASATELSKYTTPCTCSNGIYGNSPTPSCHYVQMHQATANFNAPVGRRINKVPRKIALLDTGAGVQYYPHMAQPLRVLDGYLQNAGLYKAGSVDNTDSGGCPRNTTSGCTLNGGQPGFIYDQFNSYEDLKSTASYPHGLLNATDSGGILIYKTYWTPHWDVSNSTANRIYTGSDCTVGGQPQCQGGSNYTTVSPWPPNPDPRQSAMDNVAYFLLQRGTGLMSECSAIENYEGTRSVTPASTQTNFLFNGPISENGIGGNFEGRNCTDPDYLALGGTRPDCVFYQHVDSPFGQIGDFHYVTQGGAVSSFGPAPAAGPLPASTYNGGISRMLIGWTDYHSTSNVPAAVPVSGSPNGWDMFDFGFVRNNTLNGAVVYIGGHEQMQSTVGNRLVLNTLMNLDYAPVGSERALSAPIAFIDNNPGTSDLAGTKSLLFAGTYSAISGYPGDPSYSTYRYEQGSHWIYPYVSGHFRTHSLIGGSTLAAGESDLFQFTLWDAADRMAVTSPAARNVFTYFGGHVATGQPGPHGLRQIGWVPEVVSGVALPNNCPSRPCVDVVKWDNVGGTLALVPGSDGICDLQQALGTSFVDTAQPLDGDCGSTNQATLQADLPKAQSMLQTILGYCFATTSGTDGILSGGNQPRLTPTLAQCNSPTAINTPMLGGIVHSTPAIVPPSVNIDRGIRKRPTVGYVGTYDGQLHAFYISGGAGYTGPSSTVSLPPGNLPANSPRAGTTSGTVFATDWATQFAAGTTPMAGTELWSFIPATQLAGLHGNNARVDASPVYMDVFIDIAGTNQREWHTVLVGSVGPTGNEIFAMDITNPLQPVLMWDIVGSTYLWGPGYPPLSIATLANDSTGGLFDTKWVNTTAYYRFAPVADPGRTTTGLYDFTDLGGSVGISLGQMRAGLAPVFGVFLSTNGSGSVAGGIDRGLEVLAMDIATGQKLWQFEQPYSQAWVPNGVPPVASLIAGPDGVNRIYVGDQEGHLWELDAATGVNINNANSICASPPCNYAAFDTGSTSANPQPITTNIGIAKIPQHPDLGSDFTAYPGNTLLLFGTAGANWVPSAVSGTIHVPFLDAVLRVPIYTGGWNLPHTINWTTPQAQTFAGTYGVLQELGPGLPHTFAVGERLFGAITIAGSKAYFATANGPVPSDIMLMDGRTTGASYSIDLQSANPAAPIVTLPVPSFANYGGMTVFHNASTGNDDVIGLEVSKISKTTDTTGHSAPNRALSLTGQGGLIYYLKLWVQRFFP